MFSNYIFILYTNHAQSTSQLVGHQAFYYFVTNFIKIILKNFISQKSIKKQQNEFTGWAAKMFTLLLGGPTCFQCLEPLDHPLPHPLIQVLDARLLILKITQNW
jgi:hypothetical protein